MKKFIVAMTLFSLMLPGFAMALETQEDPYAPVKELSFEKCDQSFIDEDLAWYASSSPKIIHTADDGSYFDVVAKNFGNEGVTSAIRRSFCYSYTSSAGVKKSSGGTLDLSEYAINDGLCFAVEMSGESPVVDVIDSLEAKDMVSLCFEPNKYVYPAAPKNFTVLKADSGVLQFQWDKISNADGYQVYGTNFSAYKDQAIIKPTEIKDNTVTFTLDPQDFYCFNIASLADGASGKWASALCYNGSSTKFEDVPLTSWYYPYLATLQAERIVGGYKDSSGKETGFFGPTDNVTVAESLKIVLHNYYNPEVEVVVLNKKLTAHWAENFIKQGTLWQFSILNDLEKFNPDRPITRGEFVQLFLEHGLEQAPPAYDSFSLNDISTYKYANSIEYAYRKGLVSGYADGSFKPDAFINRAEMVKLAKQFRSAILD